MVVAFSRATVNGTAIWVRLAVRADGVGPDFQTGCWI